MKLVFEITRQISRRQLIRMQHFNASDPSFLQIGLVNNMPASAQWATELQFRARLQCPGSPFNVQFTSFAISSVKVSEHGDAPAKLDALWNEHLDGLIVTGTEPHVPQLKEEPYWDELTDLIDWACSCTYSSLWSCLASHAVVLHLDGIPRRALEAKRFGVFECENLSRTGVMDGTPKRLQMPHSRWNELSEADLSECGYDVLTRSSAAGVDSFAKDGRSFLIFFQGHPEYSARTLLHEYRRDIGRFLSGETDFYPSIPVGYFDKVAYESLSTFRSRAIRERKKEVFAEFPTESLASSVSDPWSVVATQVFQNWLGIISARKSDHMRRRQRPNTSHSLGQKASASNV